MKIKQAAAPVEQPRLLTVITAAQYLSTSKWMIRELVYKRRVPHVKLGKKVFIDKADLDRFVDGLKKAS